VDIEYAPPAGKAGSISSPLDDMPRGYEMFRNMKNNCEKAVLKP
jgi:hypothetical protein